MQSKCKRTAVSYSYSMGTVAPFTHFVPFRTGRIADSKVISTNHGLQEAMNMTMRLSERPAW
jgi:hypothetical protein